MPEMNITTENLQAQIDAYTKRVKDGAEEIPLTREQIDQIDKALAQSGYQNDAFSLARDGVYSQIEAVPLLLKNYLGTKKVNEFLENYGTDVSKPEVQDFLRRSAMDGTFRVGLSIARHQGTIQARELQECERFLNRHVMEQTLGPMSQEGKREILQQPDSEKLLNMNLEKRILMIKLMVMCQLGRFDEKREDGQTKPYEDTIAEAFAHGGRTKFALPYGGNQKDMIFNAVMAEDDHPNGMKRRYFATHYVSSQKVDDNGNTVSEMKEERPKRNLFKIMPKQFGMNVAVGGMGEMGPHGQRIVPDGSNGHMYIRVAEGGEHTCGSLLVGFENSGPSKKSRIGSSHGASAKSAGQSAFMADKGVPGAVIDGRTVDLSGIKSEDFQNFMVDLEKALRARLSNAEYYDNHYDWEPENKQMKEFVHQICGEQLEPTKLTDLLAGLGLKREAVEKMVNAGRSRKPMKDYTLDREKVQPIPDDRAENWNKDLETKLFNELNLNLSVPKHLKRLQVMEKCAGEWKLTPLFDAQKHATPQARYNRFRALVNEGKEIYAYGAGEVLPRKLELNKDTLGTTVSDRIPVTAPREPVQPKGYKRFLHKLSLGLLYSQTMKDYEKEKQAYAQEQQKFGALDRKQTERSNGPAARETHELLTARNSAERRRSMSMHKPSAQAEMTSAQRSRSNSLRPKPEKSGPVK